jgi:hypothetical protein
MIFSLGSGIEYRTTRPKGALEQAFASCKTNDGTPVG